MGGGLVFFGIGGDTSGGLFDAFSDDAGERHRPGVYDEQIQDAQASLTEQPERPAGARRSPEPSSSRPQPRSRPDEQGAETLTEEALVELRGGHRRLGALPGDEARRTRTTSVARLMMQAYSTLAIDGHEHPMS